MKETSAYKTTLFLLMLIMPASVALVSCSSTPEQIELTGETVKQWNAAVEQTITEPQRAAEVKDLGRRLIEVSRSVSQDIEVYNQKVILLNENYDATKAEFQQLVNEFVEIRTPKLEQFRDILFAIRSKVSAEEWKHLMY